MPKVNCYSFLSFLIFQQKNKRICDFTTSEGMGPSILGGRRRKDKRAWAGQKRCVCSARSKFAGTRFLWQRNRELREIYFIAIYRDGYVLKTGPGTTEISSFELF